jgi:hypothetical protein
MFPTDYFPPDYFPNTYFPSEASSSAPPLVTGDLKQAIVAALGVQPAAVALFGNRIFPVVIPQTAQTGAPSLTYQFNDSTHDSGLVTPAGMRYVSVLFRVSSYNHGDVETGREVLRSFFQGYKTLLAGLPIIFVWFDYETDGYDEPISGSDIGIHWKECPFTFKLRESMPTNI